MTEVTCKYGPFELSVGQKFQLDGCHWVVRNFAVYRPVRKETVQTVYCEWIGGASLLRPYCREYSKLLIQKKFMYFRASSVAECVIELAVAQGRLGKEWLERNQRGGSTDEQLPHRRHMSQSLARIEHPPKRR